MLSVILCDDYSSKVPSTVTLASKKPMSFRTYTGINTG